MSEDLTICTVFHDAFTRACLDYNLLLTAALNDPLKPSWVVVDNSEKAASWPTADGVTVLHGHQPDTRIPAAVRGSYHHGAAVNRSIEPVTTRFALVLDVDFFIIRRSWMSALVDHAFEHGLAFFGTPWHPRWFNKYRGFPCVHCLLIDLDRVQRRDLDFRPDLVNVENSLSPDDSTAVPRIDGERRRPLTVMRNLWTMLLLRDRQVIARSRDTGFRLFERYAGRYPVECLQPVYRPEEQFIGPRHALGFASRALERFLPERLCYFPKGAQSYSRTGFRERGVFDADAHSWEEFLWHDRPFGFHFRGYHNRIHDDRALGQLRDALTSFGLPSG